MTRAAGSSYSQHNSSLFNGRGNRTGYLHAPDGHAKVSAGGNLPVFARRGFHSHFVLLRQAAGQAVAEEFILPPRIEEAVD